MVSTPRAACSSRSPPPLHPSGNPDASGFAAIGIVEGAAHAWDVLVAQGIDFRVDGDICDRVLNRVFPHARRTGDGWHDLLAATGRTDETRGTRWRWDSSVRDSYGD